jgi:hypothetical protein
MPRVTWKGVSYEIPSLELEVSWVIAKYGTIYVAWNGTNGQPEIVNDSLDDLLLEVKNRLKVQGGTIILRAGEYVLSKTFPDENVRSKILLSGEGRATVVKAPSGVSPFDPNWVRLDNLLWYDEAGAEHDETLVVVTEVPDGAITTPKIANLAVTTEKLSDGAVTNVKIADGTIDLTKKCAYVPVNKAGDTMTGDLNAMNIYPNAHATYDLGKSNVRWNNIYGVNLYGTLIQAGDLGFSEDTCPLCGKEFQVGDEVVLKVVSKEGGIKTRPCHKSCPL